MCHFLLGASFVKDFDMWLRIVRAPPRCKRCGEGHETKDDYLKCENEPKCVNCQGNHLASDKVCAKFKENANVLKVASEGNMS